MANISELKEVLAQQKSRIEESKDAAGMAMLGKIAGASWILVQKLVDVVEEQQREIDALKSAKGS